MFPEIPGYTSLELIGTGAHSRVYRVRRNKGEEQLALRLENEPRSFLDSSGLGLGTSLPRHPHILAPVDTGVDTVGRHWQLLPLIRPIDPPALVRQGGTPTALSLLTQAAAALATLHQSNSCHGDFSPSNALIQRTGKSDPWDAGFVLLADLESSIGESKRAAHDPSISGTLGYVSPQAISGKLSAPGSQSDVFALGAWLCWLLTGVEPFRGDTFPETLRLYQATRLRVRQLLQRESNYASPFWIDLVETLVHEDPDKRPMNGTTVLDHLRTRAHLFPEFDQRLPRLIWNPYGLTPREATVASEIVSVALKGGPRKFRIEELPRGRVPEFVAELRSALMVPTNELLFLSASDPLDRAIEQIQQGTHRLVFLDGTSVTPEAPQYPTLLDAWSYEESSREVENNPPIFIDLAPLIPHGVNAGQRVTTRESTMVWNLSDIPDKTTGDWITQRFGGVTLDSSLSDTLKSRGFASPIQAFEVLRGALQAGVLRIDHSGVHIADSEMSSWTERTLQLQEQGVGELSSEAHTLLYIMTLGTDDDTAAFAVRGLSPLSPWSHALAELLDTGIAYRDPETGVERIRPGGRAPIVREIAGAPHLAEFGQVLVDHRACVPTMEIGRLARFWCDRSSSKRIRGALAVAYSALRCGDATKATQILAIEPDEASSPYWRGRWFEVHGQALAAIERFSESIEMLRKAVELHESGDDGVRAAIAGMEAASQLGGIGRLDEATEWLNRALDCIPLDPHPAAARIQWRLLSERAFRNRKGGRNLNAAKEATRVLESSSADAGARSIAWKVLSDFSLRGSDATAGRQQMAASLCEARNAGGARILSRVLMGAANYEFSRGENKRAQRLIDQCSHLPSARLLAADIFALLIARGGLAFEGGATKVALRANVRALAIGRADGDRRKVQTAAGNLSAIFLDLARPGDAIELAILSMETDLDQVTHADVVSLLKLAIAHLFVGDMESLSRITGKLSMLASGLSTIERAKVIRLQGREALMSGEIAKGLALLEEVKRTFDDVGAVDESVETQLHLLNAEGPDRSSPALMQRLRGLLTEARRIENWRLLAQLRHLELAWDEGRPYAQFLEELGTLERECLERGYLVLELPILETRARRQLQEGWAADALETLRRAVERVRVIAQGLPDERLRRVYLNDPRRRVLLTLIEQARGG